MKRKVQHLLSTVLVVLFILMAFGSEEDKKSDESNNVEINTLSSNDNNQNSNVEKTDEQFITQLKREIESLDKGVDFTGYKESIDAIQMELVLFSAWAINIDEASKSENQEIKSLGEKLKSRVEKIQVAEFPKLRKAYGKIVDKKLWEQNIEVETLGNSSKTIQFTGAIFANNKNKQDTQETLSELLNLLRFKKVNYKWYEYDDEYTYYELDTAKDSEIRKL